MLFFRLLLLPLSLLYGLLMQLRNLLYDMGGFSSRSFDCPVISIGNLTAGGSGKTPFTIYLAQKMQQAGYKPAVVSRGYGRKSQGVFVVSDGQNIQSDVRLAGDEPLLIARSVPGIVVVVGEERSVAIEKAIQLANVDLILMDDGFQHRSVRRDVDILLRAWPVRFIQRFVLPAGDLREFAFNRSRADIVIDTSYTDLPAQSENDGACQFTTGMVLDLQGNPVGKLTDFAGRKVAAFCGIAHPDNFKQSLRNAGLKVFHFRALADHAAITPDFIKQLIAYSAEQRLDTVFCTAKDWVKIAGNTMIQNQFANAGISCWHTQVDVFLNNEKNILKNIRMNIDSTNL